MTFIYSRLYFRLQPCGVVRRKKENYTLCKFNLNLKIENDTYCNFQVKTKSICKRQAVEAESMSDLNSLK